jgi:hypothetical protein
LTRQAALWPIKAPPRFRQGEGDADQPAPPPVQILPEEDDLNVADRHVRVNGAVLRDRFVLVEFGRPQIDRPASPSRVMPPITTMGKIMAQQASRSRCAMCSSSRGRSAAGGFDRAAIEQVQRVEGERADMRPPSGQSGASAAARERFAFLSPKIRKTLGQLGR